MFKQIRKLTKKKNCFMSRVILSDEVSKYKNEKKIYGRFVLSVLLRFVCVSALPFFALYDVHVM